MTTFDQVWQSFLAITKVDSLDLPNTNDAIYETIQSAIRKFNMKLEDKLVGDNSTEQLNRELDGNEMELLSHCIRLIILENQLIYFSATFSPFTKEIGTRNLANQLVRLEELVKREDNVIDAILMKMVDDFI